VKYYTVNPGDDADSILRRLDKDYGLSNVYVLAKPQSLSGNAKVLTIRILKRNDYIKVDGPGFIVYEIFNRLLSKW